MRRPKRYRAQDRVGCTTRGCLDRHEPDVGDDDAPGVEPTRRCDEPDLAPMEGHGERGGDRGAGNLAGGGVHAGWHIDGDHGHAAPVHALDQRRRLRTGRTVVPGPEQRVDHDVEPLGLVCLHCLATRLPHHPRRDAPVAAVGTAAADHSEAAGARVGPHRLSGDGGARALHQLDRGVRVPRILLFRSPHLCRCVEGLEHVQPRHGGGARSTSATHTAPAIVCECVSETSMWRRPTRSAKARVFPVRVTPGFCLPTISISFQVNRTPHPSALPTASLPQNRAA